MTKIKRRDVPKGAAYSMSVAFGERTYAEATDAWGGVTGGGGTGGATLTISTRRGDQQLAPEAVVFSAAVEGFDSQPPAPGTVYNAQLHDIDYEWTFGDPGTYSSYERMLPQWNNRNIGSGPFPCHIFPGPGTYTVICTAHERASGKSASATIDITVGNADTYFTDAQTICIDPDGDFTSAPTTVSANRVTTLAAAFTRWGVIKGAGPVRILLKSGKTHPMTVGWNMNRLPNVYINKWGGAANAKILIQSDIIVFMTQGQTTSGAIIANIDFEGAWDASIPGWKSGYTYHPNGAGTAVELRSGFGTVYNCHCEGVKSGFMININYAFGTVGIVGNSSVENWQDIGAYMETEGAGNDDGVSPLLGYQSFIGCRLTQHEYASSGGIGKGVPPVENWHGALRIQTVGTVYVDGLEGFSRNGWMSPGNVPDEQNIIRDHRNDKRTRAFFTRILGEGGMSAYSCGTVNGGQINPSNGVIEKFYFLGSQRQTNSLGISCGAMTARDGIVHKPNSKQGPNGYDYAIMLGQDHVSTIYTGDNTKEPIKLYNVTCINEMSTTNQPGSWSPVLSRTDRFNDGMIQVANLVVHRPNHTAAVTSDAPLDATRLGFPTRYHGQKWSTSLGGNPPKPVMDTTYANPADPFALWRPLPGSAAIDSATGPLVSRTDMFGTLRGPSPSRGALEPA